MTSRPPAAALAALAALAAFTIFITWRAKLLESSLQHAMRAVRLVDKPAPNFTLHSLDGRTVSLSDYRGKKKVVVSFWASWCGPCRLEMPTLTSFYKNYHQTSGDFEILAVNTDDDQDAAQSFATDAKLDFPVLIDGYGKAASAYGVMSIPMLFVVDKEGMVRYGHVGFTPTLEQELKHELEVGNSVTVKGALDAGPSH